MYTREIQAPVKFPVQNGKPVQGTWTRPFESINLLDTCKPFSIELPRWLSNCRIKEWQSLVIQNERIFFESFTANLKFFRFIEVAFFDKKTGDTSHYTDSFPFGLWELPSSLNNSAIECRAPGYSMSIQNKLSESRIAFFFEILPNEQTAGIETQFELNVDPKKRPPLVTSLLFSESRSVVSYKHLGAVAGTLNIGNDTQYIFEPQTTMGLFRDCRGFFPYMARCEYAGGFSAENEGRLIAFSLTENQAKWANRDNENVLWVNNTLTALPPVRITHAEGIDQNWVIEDVEGMIDLNFTPKYQTERKGFDMLLSKVEFHNPVGVFNGMIVSKDGEEINLRNMWGCAESLRLRL